MSLASTHRRVKAERRDSDFYPTPRSLVWVATQIILSEFDLQKPILEPCCGTGVLNEELEKLGFKTVRNDLYHDGVDYTTELFDQRQVITNPPFSLWDEFVGQAKSHCDKVMMIGRISSFATHSRNVGGVWDNLKGVYIFDRYVDYQTPLRDDGKFHVGAWGTAWFLWDLNYTGKPYLQVLDVNQYATLGVY